MTDSQQQRVPDAENCARAICAERYPTARVVFFAGSAALGQHTSSSDLDLVVLYAELPNAYRESFHSQGWPVEAFVHDAATLRYFFELDRVRGVPPLATMVATGIAIPTENEIAASMRQLAQESLASGPPAWTEAESAWSRYMITDLANDLRAPRAPDEAHAIAARLYETLANHYLRVRGLWSARGKAIPRRLREVDEAFAGAFVDAFRHAFSNTDASALLILCEQTLADDGGLLFDGYRADAPVTWRRGSGP